MTTSQDKAVIRPYVHENEENKLVRFTIGKAAMEPLALGNIKLSIHPITIAIWLAVSSACIQLLNWWPDPKIGILGYFRPLPILAAAFLPFVFFFDWYQRPTYNQQTIDILSQPDINDIKGYYSRDPSTGLWIYEYGQNFVGLVAIDTTNTDARIEIPETPLTTATPTAVSGSNVNSKSKRSGESKSKKEQPKSSPSSSSPVALIRHLYVSEPYRVAHAQDDLIQFASKRIFVETDKERIVIRCNSLFDYLTSGLKKAGFELIDKSKTEGWLGLGWPTYTYELTRGKWSALQKN